MKQSGPPRRGTQANRKKIRHGPCGTLAALPGPVDVLVMCLTRDWLPEPLKEAELVRGATLPGGLYELEPLRSVYIGDAIGLTAAESARTSPIRNVHKDLSRSVITSICRSDWATRDIRSARPPSG
ncbi:hypothetical protein [Amycolatopsis plumensis]|uniref:Uncharacterized protein n=1 Tax=Amycolatopsis plumensis TaxID=236508 RepID=A0ABV5U819_9PSEU